VLSYEIARKYMPASQVEDVLDVDRLLWMLAFDILTVNLDSPVNVAHNFYLYQDGAFCFRRSRVASGFFPFDMHWNDLSHDDGEPSYPDPRDQPTKGITLNEKMKK
jgi:hypothetical protein